MKLNEKILYYRKAAKLSQEELAARVGVSRQAVSKWELGDATPEVDKLLALARAFGVTTDELLGGDEPAGTEKRGEPPREEPHARTGPSPGAPPVSRGDFDKAAGLIGRLVRRYGWLAGVRIALSGLGVTIVGALARWGFGAMFGTANQMMGSIGGFGGGWSYDGPPELEAEIMRQLGLAPVSSPMSGMEGFFLGFATVILVIGVLTVAAGTVLAAVLYKKGRKKP